MMARAFTRSIVPDMYNGTTLTPTPMTEIAVPDWSGVAEAIRKRGEPPDIVNIGGFRVAVHRTPAMRGTEWFIAVNGRIVAGHMDPD